ncbi:MAG: DUF4384 domain-containing protein, partial [Blastocatellia bacterium]
AMVRIELNRNGKLSYVSPKTAFRSGDKVRLHVRINRAGYLTVLNEGTSGHLQLLYPRTLANASARVSPTLDFTVPATPGKWLEFDDRTGTERLHIMLSAQPIPDVVTFLALNSGGGAPVSTAGSTGSSGATADGPAQEQEVVDALNSKAFRGLLDSSSKDFTETGEDQTEQGEVAVFVVTTGANTDLKKPIVYKLALEHGN